MRPGWKAVFSRVAICGRTRSRSAPFLGLHDRTSAARHLERARTLVHDVHHVLGRHRPDDARTGWLSGLTEDQGERHPTAGGLRIGKPLPERKPEEPRDPDLEWDRDGQYYHYLTRWMHALGRMAATTGERAYHRWAAELARMAHARFTYGPPGSRRMVWKMSVDPTRVLVPRMGQHDPLDGLITAAALQDSPVGAADAPDLEPVIADLSGTCEGRNWATDDPLGIGGLLVDALRLAEMVAAGTRPWRGLLKQVAEEAALSLHAFSRRSPLRLPLEHRLAFRELGLALHASERLRHLMARVDGALDPGLGEVVARLTAHQPMAREIEDAWLDPRAQRTGSWLNHEDINAISLATGLVPEGYLGA